MHKKIISAIAVVVLALGLGTAAKAEEIQRQHDYEEAMENNIELVTDYNNGISLFSLLHPEIGQDPIDILGETKGRYALNYTGNSNNSITWWNGVDGGIAYERHYDDLGLGKDNSKGVLRKGASDARIAKAVLIWRTRSSRVLNNAIHFYTPDGVRNGTYTEIYPEKTRVDIRENDGQYFNSYYSVCADVTDIVQNAGYGAYAVSDIPTWDKMAEQMSDGTLGTGGGSPCSWQLVIVEESSEYPIRQVWLNMAAKFYKEVNFSWTVRSDVESKNNGVVTGQLFYGMESAEGGARERYATKDINGNVLRDNIAGMTDCQGNYIDGVCMNPRVKGWAPYPAHRIAKDCTRTSLRNIPDMGNYMNEMVCYVENNAWTTAFLFGAAYDINMYTVTYDPNGADGGYTERQTCLFNQNYNIEDNGYTFERHEFLGWNTKADGTGQWWYPGQSYNNLCTVSGDDYKVYAIWKPLGVIVTLDNQGANIKSGTASYYEKYGVRNYTNMSCTTPIDSIENPERTGYVFKGYYQYPNGQGHRYITEGGGITATCTEFTVDTTIYAYWVPGVYKITLDNQGATGAGTRCYYEKYGVGNYSDEACTSPISWIVIPTKNGRIFRGYYDQKKGNGGLDITDPGEIVTTNTKFTCDTTIYANWENLRYTITCDGQGATAQGTERFYEKYDECFYFDMDVIDDGEVDIDFSYTGAEQVFIAPYTGTYTLNVWGAQGGGVRNYNNKSAYADGGLGGHAKGTINLTKGEKIYIMVGGQPAARMDEARWNPDWDGSSYAGEYYQHVVAGGWNGGGHSTNVADGDGHLWGGGGGATDIRRTYNTTDRRIIVAGGGGGASAICQSVVQGGPGGLRTYYVLHALSYNSLFQNAKVLPETDEYHSDGCGGQGAGGGYYGGRCYYMNYEYQGHTGIDGYDPYNVKDYSIDGRDGYHYMVAGEGGSNYTGGVDNGTEEAGVQYGNGYARVTRNNYHTEERETTWIYAPQRDGYYFNGYFTQPNGAGDQIVDKYGNISVSPDYFDHDATVYAYWTTTDQPDVQTYQIIYDGNGSDAGSMTNSNVRVDTTYTLKANEYSKTSNTFLGWSNSRTGGVVWADTQQVYNLAPANGSVTLYAVWKPYEYTIVYDKNQTSTNRYGDTYTTNTSTVYGSTGDTTVRYGSSFNINANGYSRTGYSFAGWNSKSDGSGEWFGKGGNGSDRVNITQSGVQPYSKYKNWSQDDGDTFTLYAIWEPNKYSINYESNDDSLGDWNVADSYSQAGVRVDQTVQLLENKFKREAPILLSNGVQLEDGYNYIGWGRTGNETSAVYGDKASVKNLAYNNNGSLSLKALWKKDLQLTLSPNPNATGAKLNGSTANKVLTASIYNHNYTYGFNIGGYYGSYNNNGINSMNTIVDANGIEGRFLGFATDGYSQQPDSITDVYSGNRANTYSIFDNTTLYAIWEPVLKINVTLGRQLDGTAQSAYADAVTTGNMNKVTFATSDRANYSVLLKGFATSAGVKIEDKFTEVYQLARNDSEYSMYDDDFNDAFLSNDYKLNKLVSLNTLDLTNEFGSGFYIPQYLLGYQEKRYGSVVYRNFAMQVVAENDRSYYWTKYRGQAEQAVVNCTISVDKAGGGNSGVDEEHDKLKYSLRYHE